MAGSQTGFKSVLALDTALNNCSVAVYAGGKAVFESAEMMQGHAEHLLPMAERVLGKAGVKYGDIECIAATAGPGAFTGLRIGLSAARGVALALGIPLYGITTTQILALQQVKQKPAPVAVILETKRADFYVQFFDAAGRVLSEAAALPAEEIDVRGFELAGDGVERFNGQRAAITVPDMALAAASLAVSTEFFTQGAAPVYLRGADITTNKRPQRVYGGSLVRQ